MTRAERRSDPDGRILGEDEAMEAWLAAMHAAFLVGDDSKETTTRLAKLMANAIDASIVAKYLRKNP